MLVRSPSTRRRLLLAAVLLLALLGAAVTALPGWHDIPGIPSAAPGPAAPDPAAPDPAAPPSRPAPTAYLHVNPAGSDDADGSPGAPLRTIQAALDRATPGTQITLAPGVYTEQLTTTHAGTADAPITVKGPETGTDPAGRHRATLYGTGRIISIDHSHYVLDGFTVDGQQQLAGVPFPTDLAAVDAFKDRVQAQVDDTRLVYVGAAEDTRDLTGTTITNMFLQGAGGECVRFRNNAHDNAVTDSVIRYCGMFGKDGDDDRTAYHNGEGVYIGTSPESDGQPMSDNDTSSHNLVARNVIATFGSECFNVKENAHDNVFEHNTCSDNAESVDFNGSNIELRGHDNVVRDNTVTGSAGYSVKIASDDEEYDNSGNTVTGNRLGGSLVAFMLDPDTSHGPICGNAVATGTVTEGGGGGDVTAPCPL
jgi:hypothetical protein